METTVINLVGGPGSGKSTTAAGVFYNLKKRGIECEMSLEFAKDKVWEESFRMMDNQYYIFGKQHHRLWRLVGKVPFVITDSPLIISSIYDSEKSEGFKMFVGEQFKKYNNVVYFIERDKNYVQTGRIQTQEESECIDVEIQELLKYYGVPFTKIPQRDAVEIIVDEIIRKI